MARRCLNIAHRGASVAAPENTMASFLKAIEAGADMIELDVHLTRDNHFVVIHDKDIGRTTAGSGNVTEMTLAELKELDAGSYFSSAYAGERIPTLEEVIELTRGKVGLNIEVKASHPSEDLVVDSLLAVLAKEGIVYDVLISSFSRSILEKVRKRSPLARTAFIYRVSFSPLANAKGIDASALHPNVAAVSHDLVRKAHAVGMTVNVWTEDDPREMRRLLDMDVDGIITNDPYTLQEVLAA